MTEESKKRGLGRGLMSLFGDERASGDISKNEDIILSNKQVSISNLVRNRFQPRIIFDKEKIDELSKSITQNGVIQPIAVRPDKQDKSKFEIIAGERRWLAAQQAGLHEVPVIILNLNDNQSLEVAIVENIQREDLNSIEEAKAYDRLIKDFSYDHEKLSKFMGKSRSHISNTLRLLSLPKEVIKMVEDGKLTAGQVRPLIGRSDASDMAKLIQNERLSARSIENLVRANKQDLNKKAYKLTNDANTSSVQNEIEASLGLKVNIMNKKNNSGKIIVEYKNLEQLELVSSLLKTKRS
jgi:ParB family chromosome partitioning protein